LRIKLISAILSVAVMLSLMLVPAVPTAVAQANDWGYEIQPNITKVGINTDFNVTVSAVCYAGNAGTWQIMVDFDQTYLQVIGITRPATLPNGDVPDGYPGEPRLDNTTGWVYDGYGRIAGHPTINVTFAAWTIHFKSKGVQTESTPLNFTYVDPYNSTDVFVSGGSCLNSTGVFNGTVKIGSPTLTVNVNPPGDGTVNQVPSAPYTWDQVVTLTAVNSTAGWGWASWSGTDNDAVNPTTVTMSTDKTVNATFAELPPQLSVTPTVVNLSARQGANSANGTVKVSNTGGGLLNWTAAWVPTWAVNDTWSWMEYYDRLPNGTPCPNPNYTAGWGENNTPIIMTVTGVSDPNNYTAFVNFPVRTQRSMEGLAATLVNATATVDKATLGNVKQVANVLINLGGLPGYPLTVYVSWDYAPSGVPTLPHDWPYSPGKFWWYNVTKYVPGVMPLPETSTCYAFVNGTGPTPIPVPTSVAPAGYLLCWQIIHVDVTANPLDPANGTPFKSVYWSDAIRNFVMDVDGGTYDAPPPYIRSLLSDTWILSPTSGSLATGLNQTLKVTANVTGLGVGIYQRQFNVSGSPNVTVTVNLEVLPATTIDVIRNLPADALDMDAEYPGMTFPVWVNFTASVANFTSIGLTDLAPAGWAVQTDINWCDPQASWTKGEGNKAEYAWAGPFAQGTVFHARYNVTIPATAANGWNYWPNNDGTKAWAEYWFGPLGPYTSNVTGESQKMITVPGKIVGETRDVNADLLTTTLVVLSEQPTDDEPEDSDSSTAPNANYVVWADDTGQYWMEASKYCYFPLDTWSSNVTAHPTPFLIDFTDTAKLAAGYALDFEGDYGLVPKACTMSYAMKSVNHWLFVPINGLGNSHPEWRLSNWKAMESVHSWQFPTGCNL